MNIWRHFGCCNRQGGVVGRDRDNADAKYPKMHGKVLTLTQTQSYLAQHSNNVKVGKLYSRDSSLGF